VTDNAARLDISRFLVKTSKIYEFSQKIQYVPDSCADVLCLSVSLYNPDVVLVTTNIQKYQNFNVNLIFNFETGCSDVTIGIFVTCFPNPFSVIQTQENMAVTYICWATNEPHVFYSLNSKSELEKWDLKSATKFSPVYTEKIPV